MGRRDFQMPEAVDYRAVLDDLKSRRTALDQAISAVEAIIGALGDGTLPSGATTKGIEADTFIGMNINQAAEKYLKIVGRPARTTEQIADALNKGGLTVSVGSVSTILRRSDKGDAAVTKVGRALWGLADWYPNRPRRSRQGNGDAE
jgi:hypothetical protein